MVRSEREIFNEALDLPADRRAAFLDGICAGDGRLRRRIEDLLRASAEASGFLDAECEVAEEIGTRLGAYRLTARIGEGGFGVVYRAEQERPVRREVALKILKLGMDTRAVIARFEAERQALALMNHAHIARVFDGGATSSGRPYFVMELVTGRPVTAYCREHSLSVRARLELFLQVCGAVHHAHQKGVIHRDLKPTNILVATVDGRPHAKVIDFGIAKATREPLTERTLHTRLHLFVGTPAYMSPEQRGLGEAGVDTRSDIYSLGAVLHEMLVDAAPAAGRPGEPVAADLPPPSQRFRALGPEAQLRVARERGARPDRLAAALRGDLDQIVLKCLETDRARRYETVEDLARDIERHLNQQPVLARPATFGYRAGKFVRRHRRPVAVALLGGVLLAALAVYHAHRLAAERDRAQLAAQRAARVSELLTDALTAPDPFRTPANGDPTAGLFATTIAQARRELADEPALRARILTAVGRVYLRLGRHAPAAGALAEAVQALRTTGGRDPVLAQALSQMGVLLREQGDFGGAVRHFQESLDLQRGAAGAEPNDIAIALVELGRTYEQLERFPDAERVFREALALRRRALGEVHREVAVSCGDLGQALRFEGRLDEAAPWLSRCIELHRRTVGDEHPNVAISQSNLALLERDRGNFAAADALYDEALPRVRRTLGADHWRTARMMGALAGLRIAEGRLDEAEHLLGDALGIVRRNPGDRPLESELQVEQARLRLARGDPAGARPLLEAALGAQRQWFPERGWRVSTTRSLLGAALLELGRLPEAEALLLEAERGLPEREGPCGRETAANRGRLARLYDALGQPARAAHFRPAPRAGLPR